MVAYDSRRSPNPSQLLSQETVTTLRDALVKQREAGQVPIDDLRAAIRVAVAEGHSRDLPPEALLIQLKALADDMGVAPPEPERRTRSHVREWMVRALLRAYWDLPDG